MDTKVMGVFLEQMQHAVGVCYAVERFLQVEDDTTESMTLNINIGDCDMNYESGKLIIPKNKEIDKIDEEHIKWGTRKN
jgi:hypothetical protein